MAFVYSRCASSVLRVPAPVGDKDSQINQVLKKPSLTKDVKSDMKDLAWIIHLV